jgi:hypothetical protein
MSIPIELNPLGVPKDKGPNIFQLTIKITDAPNQTLNLGQANNTANNAIIKDWGDGTIDNKASHTYVANGTYIVSLSNPNNITLSPFYPWRSSSLVVGCNWKWDSLGDVRSIAAQTYLNNYSTWENGVCTSLPQSLTNMTSFFAYPADLPCYITSIPDGVTNLGGCGNMNKNATFVITKLPPNITSIGTAFRNFPPKLTNIIDIDEIVKNAPTNGFTQLTSINGFAQGCQFNQGATIAKFMNKCPSVTNIGGNSVDLLNGSPIAIFGDGDHFECTVNIPSDNYVWGFTPISTGGTWYLVQWGDSTDASPNLGNKASKSLYTFTSGTKVAHTYAKAGTYTIKLCTHTDSITFDPVISHNNQLQFLGNINGVSFN